MDKIKDDRNRQAATKIQAVVRSHSARQEFMACKGREKSKLHIDKNIEITTPPHTSRFYDLSAGTNPDESLIEETLCFMKRQGYDSGEGRKLEHFTILYEFFKRLDNQKNKFQSSEVA